MFRPVRFDDYGFQVYPPAEARVDTVVNVASAALGALYAVILIVAAWPRFDGIAFASLVIGAVTLPVMLVISAIYHATPSSPRKLLLRRLDYTMIFMNTAGVSSPLCLIAIGGETGWLIFGVMWAVALFGSASKLAGWHAPRWLAVLLYIAQGSVMALAIGELADVLPRAAFLFYIGGAALFVIGSGFYLAKRMAYSKPIWHLFVIVASSCLFLTTLTGIVLVVPPNAA